MRLIPASHHKMAWYISTFLRMNGRRMINGRYWQIIDVSQLQLAAGVFWVRVPCQAWHPHPKQPEVSVVISIILFHRDSITQGVHDYELINNVKVYRERITFSLPRLTPWTCQFWPSPPALHPEELRLLMFSVLLPEPAWFCYFLYFYKVSPTFRELTKSPTQVQEVTGCVTSKSHSPLCTVISLSPKFFLHLIACFLSTGSNFQNKEWLPGGSREQGCRGAHLFQGLVVPGHLGLSFSHPVLMPVSRVARPGRTMRLQ